MIDLNVLLDVIQKREPHFGASAKIVALAAKNEINACFPSHCLTSLHYIIQKYADTHAANRAIDWVLGKLHIQPENERDFLRARSIPMPDFEDAVVSAIAGSSKCTTIITRNVTDFKKSPIPAMTPEEFLATLPRARSRK
ncbi:MAG: PIN domain-containing protein [Kiritimatiellia bacterium]|nr:PIN domain-containing protein [Kiritimatiellia bacterium]MDP6810180.1 PIN domain-containing protein [Kiritimatiellia bacterium]MDP7022914.1 PIN domain-containing protein [Kiritimatiellia bacterium]